MTDSKKLTEIRKIINEMTHNAPTLEYMEEIIQNYFIETAEDIFKIKEILDN